MNLGFINLLIFTILLIIETFKYPSFYYFTIMKEKKSKPETIQVKLKTKNEFEKERFRMRQKEGRLITQDEFINILIETWRKNK